LSIAETNLKKQSQFASGQNGVKLYLKGVYGNMMAWGMRKNKANLFVLSAACCVLRTNKSGVYSCSFVVKLKKQSQFSCAACCVLRYGI